MNEFKLECVHLIWVVPDAPGVAKWIDNDGTWEHEKRGMQSGYWFRPRGRYCELSSDELGALTRDSADQNVERITSAQVAVHFGDCVSITLRHEEPRRKFRPYQEVSWKLDKLQRNEALRFLASNVLRRRISGSDPGQECVARLHRAKPILASHLSHEGTITGEGVLNRVAFADQELKRHELIAISGTRWPVTLLEKPSPVDSTPTKLSYEFELWPGDTNAKEPVGATRAWSSRSASGLVSHVQDGGKKKSRERATIKEYIDDAEKRLVDEMRRVTAVLVYLQHVESRLDQLDPLSAVRARLVRELEELERGLRFDPMLLLSSSITTTTLAPAINQSIVDAVSIIGRRISLLWERLQYEVMRGGSGWKTLRGKDGARF